MRSACLPVTRLAVVYLAFAHLCALTALAVVTLTPASVTGFFYHTRMLAVVHLVTLGWISSAIMGALFIVGPLALRMPLQSSRADGWACGVMLIGIAGLVSHFWIDQMSGMAWSAVMTLGGMVHLAVRVWRAIGRSTIPGGVKLHVALAFANLVGAATIGVLIGVDKVRDIVPGYVLANVYAHAHLAAIGWAVMMVVGVGYRLFPMVLPAAMPAGRSLYVSALLLEIGALGTLVSLVMQSRAGAVFAAVTVGGLAAFGWHVIRMLRNPRPAPKALARPDYATRHALLALVSLALAAVLGLVLAAAAPSALSLRLAPVYGTLGLVGFLGQMIVGMESRILPMYAWYAALAPNGPDLPAFSVHELGWPRVQRVSFYLWAVGLPLVATGLFTENVRLVGVAGGMLLFAVAGNTVHAARILRHAFRASRTTHLGGSSLA